MSNKEKYPESGDILEFTDQDGNVDKFEFLDLITYEGTDYAVLLPDKKDADSVYIFEVVEELDSDTDTYLGIDDQDLVDRVYEAFMKKHKDDFNFTD